MHLDGGCGLRAYGVQDMAPPSLSMTPGSGGKGQVRERRGRRQSTTLGKRAELTKGWVGRREGIAEEGGAEQS